MKKHCYYIHRIFILSWFVTDLIRDIFFWELFSAIGFDTNPNLSNLTLSAGKYQEKHLIGKYVSKCYCEKKSVIKTQLFPWTSHGNAQQTS